MQNERWSDTIRKAQWKVLIGMFMFMIGAAFNIVVLIRPVIEDPRLGGAEFGMYMLSLVTMYFSGCIMGDGLGNFETIDNKRRAL